MTALGRLDDDYVLVFMRLVSVWSKAAYNCVGHRTVTGEKSLLAMKELTL